MLKVGVDLCHIALVPTTMALSHPSGFGQPFGWHPSTAVLPWHRTLLAPHYTIAI